MRALHITNHRGTAKNIQHVCESVGLDIALDTREYSHGLCVSVEQADAIYEQNAASIADYDALVFTDTCMAARPYLQNMHKHSCFMIVCITNRFDWGFFFPRPQPQYREYVDLMRAVSHHPDRVLFCADNEYDRYYAAQIRHIRVMSTVVAPTPRLGSEPCTPAVRLPWCVYDRGTPVDAFLPKIQAAAAKQGCGEIEVYSPSRQYESTAWLAANHAACLHLPYQTNIMSVWEQLGHGLPYIVPTKRLLLELVRSTQWYYWEEREWTDESIHRSAWYSTENAPLFIYFDAWTDLADITTAQLDAQRTLIGAHMAAHNERHLATWRRALTVISGPR